MTPADPRVALFTISYAGDVEMCRALCASVDRLAPQARHYLAIDRVDRALFEPMLRPGRELIETESLLPEFRQTTLLGRRVWLTPYGPPVRGWILQQMVKLEAVSRLQEEAVVIVDSDAVLVRPLDPARLLRDGRTRLYRAPGAGQAPGHRVWHRVAARVLGLPPSDYFGADYITTAVTWRPEVVRALLARIRGATRLPWRMALSWRFRFSEYILYGVFAEHAPGPQRDRVFFDDADLCHCSWHYDLDDPAQAQAFVADLRDDHAAVLIQSNLGMDDETRAALLLKIAERVDN